MVLDGLGGLGGLGDFRGLWFQVVLDGFRWFGWFRWREGVGGVNWF